MDMNDTGNRVIVGIVAVLLIIGAWYLGTTFKPSSVSKSATSGENMTDTSSSGSSGVTVSTPIATVTVGGEAVSVKDQPAGSFVVVESANLSQEGWVAVRDASGRTLGAARLDAGAHSAVQVELLRGTEAGQKYQVLLYADNGDKEFDLHTDTLVMNSDGSVAGASFSALSGN